MNKHQKNRIDMFGATLLVLNNNRDIINVIPEFAEAVMLLQTKISELETIAEGQIKETDGVTVAKNDVKNELINKVFELVCSAKPYAAKSNNAELMGVVESPKTYYRRATDESIVTIVNNVMEATERYRAELVDFGWEEVDYNELRTIRDRYLALLSRPRSEESKKESYTKLLFDKIGEITDYLRMNIDPLVARLRSRYELFYYTYHNARKIEDRGIRHTTLEGEVRDHETNRPIYNVTVLVNALNLELKTNLEGVYQKELIKPGVYTLTFKMEGYAPVTIAAFEIKRGHTVRKNLAMMRLAAEESLKAVV